MPLQGIPLAVLVGVWVAGRLAVGASAWIGAGIAAVLDLSFLTLLLGVVLREILAGRNWRNLPMPLVLGGLLVANALTHADAVGLAATGPLGQRLGIGIVILLIGLVGGRIIPSFTLNWLKKRGELNLPASFGALDRGRSRACGFRPCDLGGRSRKSHRRGSADRRRRCEPGPSRALARPSHLGRASGLEPAPGFRLGGRRPERTCCPRRGLTSIRGPVRAGQESRVGPSGGAGAAVLSRPAGGPGERRHPGLRPNQFPRRDRRDRSPRRLCALSRGARPGRRPSVRTQAL